MEFIYNDKDFDGNTYQAEVTINEVDIAILDLIRRSTDGELTASAFDREFAMLRPALEYEPDEETGMGYPTAGPHFGRLHLAGLTKPVNTDYRADVRERITPLGRAVMAENSKIPALVRDEGAKQWILGSCRAAEKAAYDWQAEMKSAFDPASLTHWLGVVHAAGNYGLSEETGDLRARAFCEYVESPLVGALQKLASTTGQPVAERGRALLELAKVAEAGGVQYRNENAGWADILDVGEIGRMLRTVEAAPAEKTRDFVHNSLTLGV